MTVSDGSKHLLKSGATGIPWKPDEEFKIIDDLIREAKADHKEGDIYFVISTRWFHHWMRYTGQPVGDYCTDDCCSSETSNCGEKPGPIDNTDIVMILNNDPQLIFDMEEQLDYELLPLKAWQALYRWYKGGPTLPRKMIALGENGQLIVEVFPLCLKLIDSRDETEPGTVISLSRKASLHELYERVCRITNLDFGKFRLWDNFNSGRLLISSENSLEESNLLEDHEILVEVQVNGTWPPENGMDSTGNKLAIVPVEPMGSPLATAGGPALPSGYSKVVSDEDYEWDELGNELGIHNLKSLAGMGSSDATSGGSTLSSYYSRAVSNDNFDRSESDYIWGDSDDRFNNLKDAPERIDGLVGLYNLGNTCYMNSALQCLVHTLKLGDYFVKSFSHEINKDNPLGNNGELAFAFGSLLRELWYSGSRAVRPDEFKKKLGLFAPQFSGFDQHDSQEFLAFLLDGLHEDLNRVKQKPYMEANDFDGRPDSEVADELWRYHKARNDSVIVNNFQGQYKSTLVCPVCKKTSVTFDPFMYLSLPLPSISSMRKMRITVFHGDESSLARTYTVTVPAHGCCLDLQNSLATTCCLRNDEYLLLALVCDEHIFKYYENPTEPISVIDDVDCIVAYTLPKRASELTRLEIYHRHRVGTTSVNASESETKLFLTPIVTFLEDTQSGADIQLAVSKVLSSLRRKPSCTSTMINPTEKDESLTKADDTPDKCPGMSLEIYVTNAPSLKSIPIEKDTPVRPQPMLQILLGWSKEDEELYDFRCLMELPSVYPPIVDFEDEEEEESISLFSCLDAFMKEEPLGPDDMWYCSHCEEHRKATKKLDLWRLPDILIFHLKRFSYDGGLSKGKLGTFVDFPIENLDLSKYVKCNDPSGRSQIYDLYAVSNHYGEQLGSGHYSAHCKNGNHWYLFDDANVWPVQESRVKTSDAYMLFYETIDLNFDDMQTNREVGESSRGCQDTADIDVDKKKMNSEVGESSKGCHDTSDDIVVD